MFKGNKKGDLEGTWRGTSDRTWMEEHLLSSSSPGQVLSRSDSEVGKLVDIDMCLVMCIRV